MPPFSYLSMPPSTPDNLEKKAVLLPEGLGKVFMAALPGTVLPIKHNRAAVEAIFGQSPIGEKIFPGGQEGVTAKREFSRDGGVIVQKGIVIHPEHSNRILMHNRVAASAENPGHRVVTGRSILLSGDGRKDVWEIVEKKLILPDTQDVGDIPTELFALGGSVAKEITYLFLLYRMKFKRNTLPSIRTTDANPDELEIVNRGVAARHVLDKPLERSILKRWADY